MRHTLWCPMELVSLGLFLGHNGIRIRRLGSLQNHVESSSLSQSWTCVLGEELGFAFGEEQDVTHKCRSALSRMRPPFQEVPAGN